MNVKNVLKNDYLHENAEYYRYMTQKDRGIL